MRRTGGTGQSTCLRRGVSPIVVSITGWRGINVAAPPPAGARSAPAMDDFPPVAVPMVRSSRRDQHLPGDTLLINSCPPCKLADIAGDATTDVVLCCPQAGQHQRVGGRQGRRLDGTASLRCPRRGGPAAPGCGQRGAGRTVRARTGLLSVHPRRLPSRTTTSVAAPGPGACRMATDALRHWGGAVDGN